MTAGIVGGRRGLEGVEEGMAVSRWEVGKWEG